MSRYLFGGSSDDYAVGSDGRPVTNRRVRFYTSTAMTTEITDLASDAAGTGSPLAVSTNTAGFWGPVYGPDGVTVMYAATVDAAGNPPPYVVAVYTHTQTGGGTSGVASFNARTGTVTLTKTDVTATGLAASDVAADVAGAAATVQTNLTTEVTRAQAAEAALSSGMIFKAAAAVATTNQALSGLPTVDGVTLTAGQVVLLTGQTSGSQNGLWSVASGAWSRPSNFAAGLDATATSVLVESGTTGAGTTYAVTGTTNNVVGTNVLTFVKTSGSGASSGAASLTPTATKTAAYTAVVGDLAMMNVAGGATVLTLPAAPADKSQVAYRAIGASKTVPLTVTAGGSDTIGIAGSTSSAVDLADETVVLQYQAANTRWISVANVKTETSLDVRYAPMRRPQPVRIVASTTLSTTASAGTLLRYIDANRRKIRVQNVDAGTVKLGYTAGTFNSPAASGNYNAATLLPGQEFEDDYSTGPLWAFTSSGAAATVRVETILVADR